MNKNQTRQPCVYGLRAGGFFYYVGKTGTNVTERLWQHKYRARSGHPAPVYDWMRSVGIDLVEIVELDGDVSRETFWIVKLLAEGQPLTNQTGRDGIENSMSAESRARIGAKAAGRETWIKGKTGEAAGWTLARKEAQRLRLATAQSVRSPRHGTRNEYVKYKCRCPKCSMEYSRLQREYRIKTGRRRPE